MPSTASLRFIVSNPRAKLSIFDDNYVNTGSYDYDPAREAARAGADAGISRSDPGYLTVI